MGNRPNRLWRLTVEYLQHHRGEKQDVSGIAPAPLITGDGAGSGQIRDPQLVAFDEVIAAINDLFSGDHAESSIRAVVAHLQARLMESEKLRRQAQANSLEQFATSPDMQADFSKAVVTAMASHEALMHQILRNPELFDTLQTELVPLLYRGFTTSAGGADDSKHAGPADLAFPGDSPDPDYLSGVSDSGDRTGRPHTGRTT